MSGKFHVPAALLPGKDPCTNYVGAGLGTRPISQYWVGLKTYSVAGIWSLGFSARRKQGLFNYHRTKEGGVYYATAVNARHRIKWRACSLRKKWVRRLCQMCRGTGYGSSRRTDLKEGHWPVRSFSSPTFCACLSTCFFKSSKLEARWKLLPYPRLWIWGFHIVWC